MRRLGHKRDILALPDDSLANLSKIEFLGGFDRYSLALDKPKSCVKSTTINLDEGQL